VISSIGLNVKIIQTIHNTVIDYPKLNKYFLKYFIRGFVAISQNVKNSIVSTIRIPAESIDVISNGIDLSKFPSQNRIINYDVKDIVCIGRLEFQKDHTNLIKSYALLKTKLEGEQKKSTKIRYCG
jgi:glycosyltransferase involved in cell wall biosynthesis